MPRLSRFYRSTLIVCTFLTSLVWLAGPAAAQQKPNIDDMRLLPAGRYAVLDPR